MLGPCEKRGHTSREGKKCRCTGIVLLRPMVSLLASMVAAYSRLIFRLASSSPVYEATWIIKEGVRKRN